MVRRAADAKNFAVQANRPGRPLPTFFTRVLRPAEREAEERQPAQQEKQPATHDLIRLRFPGRMPDDLQPVPRLKTRFGFGSGCRQPIERRVFPKADDRALGLRRARFLVFPRVAVQMLSCQWPSRRQIADEFFARRRRLGCGGRSEIGFDHLRNFRRDRAAGSLRSHANRGIEKLRQRNDILHPARRTESRDTSRPDAEGLRILNRRTFYRCGRLRFHGPRDSRLGTSFQRGPRVPACVRLRLHGIQVEFPPGVLGAADGRRHFRDFFGLRPVIGLDRLPRGSLRPANRGSQFRFRIGLFDQFFRCDTVGQPIGPHHQEALRCRRDARRPRRLPRLGSS